MTNQLKVTHSPERKRLFSEEQHESFRAWLRFKRRDVKTYVQQNLHRDLLNQIEKHCLFIGYPRSGHTLVAALLDAHPNIVISKGVDPLQYAEQGFKLSQIYWLYLAGAQRFAKKGGKSNGYAYLVPNQWNGKFDQLKVIGDKSGDLLSERLLAKPGLLDKFLSNYPAEHKFIHVIRNPLLWSASNSWIISETFFLPLCKKLFQLLYIFSTTVFWPLIPVFI